MIIQSTHTHTLFEKKLFVKIVAKYIVREKEKEKEKKKIQL